ncbi:MAG: restriction endonuclease subunit S [Bacteroidota bacterium]
MNWTLLGDIVEISKGKKHNTTEDPSNMAVRVLMIDDLRNDNNLKYTNDTKGTLVTERDILIAWDGANAGTVGFEKKGFAGSTIGVLKSKNNHFYPPYLATYLKTQFEVLQKSATGATIPHLDRRVLSNFKIPHLELDIQIKVATLLQKVQNLIQKRKESIDLLDELIRSTFLDMFGDPSVNIQKFPLVSLEEVATKITDGEHGTVQRVDSGRLYLMARNITQNGELSLNEISFISEQDHNKIYKRCNPEFEDLLLVCVGATIGKVALVPEMEEFSMARSVALIKPNRSVLNPQYLLQLFNTQFIQRQLKSRSNSSAQAGLYTGQIKQIVVTLPKIEKQNEFAKIIGPTEKIKENFKKALFELENLYNSFSQRAFNGKLDLSKIEIDHILPNETLKNNTNEGIVNFHSNLDISKEGLEKRKKEFEAISGLGDVITVDRSKKPSVQLEYITYGTVVNWIKSTFQDVYFTPEMLIKMLEDEKGIFAYYFTSKEWKENLAIDKVLDIKSTVFEVLERGLNHKHMQDETFDLKLEQVFYNDLTNNLDLVLREQDREFLANKTPEERSGIYFKIKA